LFFAPVFSDAARQELCYDSCVGKIGADLMQKQLTAIIEREGDGYVSLCPEMDIASQGNTVEEARENLREALELFFETAAPEEIKARLHEEACPGASSSHD
jgi:predicted RNase H-like HicB family nuclease